MIAGARAPEELDALLEDAFITRDAVALRALFDEDAVLAPAGAPVDPLSSRRTT